MYIYLDDIEWPDNEDWAVQDEAKDLIMALLQHSPRDRLGIGGAQEVKEHIYFAGVDWNSLLRQKAEFVPQLADEEDTSYFDSRMDRYNHELEDDTDDTDDSPLFGLFSSCSPQYRKVQNAQVIYNSDQDTEIESLSINASIASTPNSPENPDFAPKFQAVLTPEKDRNEIVPLERKKVYLFNFLFYLPLVNL